MKLTMLGTGHAMVTNCYNTCFLLSDKERYFLVDTGGGNGILRQLKAIGVAVYDIHDIFITHKHIDHLQGIYWLLRMYASAKEDLDVRIYSHREVIEIITSQTGMLFDERQKERLSRRVELIEVSDGEAREIIGHQVTFFDKHSSRATQYGFTMVLDEERKLTCLGDEPYTEWEREYAENSEWLMHEAFQVETLTHGYHATVETAAINAKKLKAKNLIIYHTEDKHLDIRKQWYTEEALRYFDGNVHVPDDLEEIDLG